MTILVTGATDKTGLKLADSSTLCSSPPAPAPFKAVEFDWVDERIFENPFKADSNRSAYLPIVKPFIDLAISNEVKRFGSLQCVPDGESRPGPWQDPRIPRRCWQHIMPSCVRYGSSRNFSTSFYLNIREWKAFSITKDGSIPYVGVNDIARAAYDALMAAKTPNTDCYLVGPELYTYDETCSQAAALLSEILGGKITHKRVTNAEVIFEAFGMPPEYAAMLNSIETKIADGVEEVLVKNSSMIKGKQKLQTTSKLTPFGSKSRNE